jgi:hypothetical protein
MCLHHGAMPPRNHPRNAHCPASPLATAHPTGCLAFLHQRGAKAIDGKEGRALGNHALPLPESFGTIRPWRQNPDVSGLGRQMPVGPGMPARLPR